MADIEPMFPGFGNGLNTATVPSWQVECSKPKNRGLHICIEASMIAIGTVTAYWIVSVLWQKLIRRAKRSTFNAELSGLWPLIRRQLSFLEASYRPSDHLLSADDVWSLLPPRIAEVPVVDRPERGRSTGRRSADERTCGFGGRPTGEVGHCRSTERGQSPHPGCVDRWPLSTLAKDDDRGIHPILPADWRMQRSNLFRVSIIAGAETQAIERCPNRPVIYQTYIGLDRRLSLILGGVNSTVDALSAFLSYPMIERLGRRKMFLWFAFSTFLFAAKTSDNAFFRGTIGQAASMFLAMACLIPFNVYHDTENKAIYGAVAGLFLFLVAFGW